MNYHHWIAIRERATNHVIKKFNPKWYSYWLANGFVYIRLHRSKPKNKIVCSYRLDEYDVHLMDKLNKGASVLG